MTCARHVARMGQMRSAYKTLIGKLERKRSLGITRRRRVDNIKTECERVD
jgi:hypothetical protein